MKKKILVVHKMVSPSYPRWSQETEHSEIFGVFTEKQKEQAKTLAIRKGAEISEQELETSNEDWKRG